MDLHYPQPRMIHPSEEATSDHTVISSVFQQAYDILEDDAKLRALKSMETERAAKNFHRLRNEYQLRTEFRHFIVDLTKRHSNLAKTFEALGFKTKTQSGEGTV